MADNQANIPPYKHAYSSSNPDCEQDSSFCHEKCESWNRDKCIEEAHNNNDCWFECSHCDKEDEENRSDYLFEQEKDRRAGL